MQQPILKKFDGLTIFGFSTRTQNSDEFEGNSAKIPALWQKFYASTLDKNIETYGVYSNYDSDANGFYTLTVGTSQSASLPDIDTLKILPGTYLVFANEGPMPQIVINTWQDIWAYFSDKPKYQRNYKTDFELYLGPNQIEIYIGIKD